MNDLGYYRILSVRRLLATAPDVRGQLVPKRSLLAARHGGCVVLLVLKHNSLRDLAGAIISSNYETPDTSSDMITFPSRGH